MFAKLFGRFAPRSMDATAAFPPLRADQPFIAIGDVHGRDDLLGKLLDRLSADHPGLPIVTVGDYVDRGDDSAKVLRRLHQRMLSGSGLTCLMGNHEEMCLRFLDDPDKNGPLWLRNGGLQTLASFGVGGIAPSSKGTDLLRARDHLARAMGDGLIDWLRGLPLCWRSGNVVVVHAGADPALPFDAQKRSSFLWGHKDFAIRSRADGLWVLHGHTIVPEPLAKAGLIAVDTGAYATGRLTAAVVIGADLRFVRA